MKRVPWERVFAGVCVLFLGLAVYKTFFLKKDKVKILPVFPFQFQQEESKSSDKNSVVAQVKSYQVEIGVDKVAPRTIEIKVHDQVVFFNKSGQSIKISGNGWGGIPLGAGENMTQVFTNKGNFPYKIDGLAVLIEGEVIVK